MKLAYFFYLVMVDLGWGRLTSTESSVVWCFGQCRVKRSVVFRTVPSQMQCGVSDSADSQLFSFMTCEFILMVSNMDPFVTIVLLLVHGRSKVL